MRRMRHLVKLVEGDEAARAALERSVLPSWVFRRNHLVVVRIERSRPLPRPLDTIRVRWGGPGDADGLQQLRFRRDGYGHLFAAGHRLVVGEANGRIVTCNWIEPPGPHLSRANGYEFDPGPAGVWVFGMEVLPEFRMSGAFHKHWNELLRLLREEGTTRVYGAVQADNPRSLNSHLRLGFEVVGEFRMMRVLGVSRYSVCAAGCGSRSGWGRWAGRDTAPGPAAIPV